MQSVWVPANEIEVEAKRSRERESKMGDGLSDRGWRVVPCTDEISPGSRIDPWKGWGRSRIISDPYTPKLPTHFQSVHGPIFRARIHIARRSAIDPCTDSREWQSDIERTGWILELGG